MENPQYNAPIRRKLKVLYDVVHKWEGKRKKNDEALLKISTICNLIKKRRRENKKIKLSFSKLKKKKKIQRKIKKKVKRLFKKAKRMLSKEEKTINKVLDLLNFIQKERCRSMEYAESSKSSHEGVLLAWLTSFGKTMPVHLGKYGQPAPPLCGAIPPVPGHIADANDMVAARVKADRETIWIIAKVLRYDEFADRYVVRDVYERQKKHTLKRKDIIPMARTAANPYTNPEALYPKGKRVMAVWPQVTTFYFAMIKEPPMKPTDDYQLLFEDNHFGGFDPRPYNVCQKYVISCDKITTC